MKPSVSIVIPVYNEAENVTPLVEEISTAMGQDLTYEIIIVDDGSDDETSNKLQALTQQYPVLKNIRHRVNYGQSAGIVSGVKAAQYDWIITLDGDRQNDPADMPLLIDALQQQAVPLTAILGVRQKRNDNWLRCLSSKMANTIRRFLLRDGCEDTGCSLKLFPRDVFLQMPHFKHCHRFLPALFKRQGLALVTVPVSHRPRVAGQSKYGFFNRLWVGISDMIGVMWLIRRPCNVEVA